MADGSALITAAHGYAPYYTTPLGLLYEGDCLDILPKLPGASVDTVFADPPFNLGKTYGRRTNDSRAEVA